MIDRLVRWLLPRQDIFFTQLEGLAAKMTATAAVFGELVSASGHEHFVAISGRLKPLETEADQLCLKTSQYACDQSAREGGPGSIGRISNE